MAAPTAKKQKTETNTWFTKLTSFEQATCFAQIMALPNDPIAKITKLQAELTRLRQAGAQQHTTAELDAVRRERDQALADAAKHKSTAEVLIKVNDSLRKVSVPLMQTLQGKVALVTATFNLLKSFDQPLQQLRTIDTVIGRCQQQLDLEPAVLSGPAVGSVGRAGSASGSRGAGAAMGDTTPACVGAGAGAGAGK